MSFRIVSKRTPWLPDSIAFDTLDAAAAVRTNFLHDEHGTIFDILPEPLPPVPKPKTVPPEPLLTWNQLDRAGRILGTLKLPRSSVLRLQASSDFRFVLAS